VKPKYEPRTLSEKLGYLVEECGEVMAAVGKTFRWGLWSVNPELPKDQQECNRDWILRELADLRGAIDRAEKTLREQDSSRV
jgi:NTP pyrophosphatase (non-canonical NTP hydrolase)